ncbi:MAG: hypothetical protein ACKVOU_11840 [Cytophagales bacterium]
MNYKYILILLFLWFGFSITIHGQATSTKDKMEAIKIGFLTDRLDLSSNQAASFWPMYNEYSAKRKELKSKIAALSMEKQIDQLNEDQISQDIKTLFSFKEAKIQLEKEYMLKFTKIISQRQAAKLYYAEREFVKILLKKLEDK